MAIVTGGMTSAQRLQTIAETRATGARVHADLRAAAARGGGRAADGGARSTRSRRVVCTGEPGASLPAVRVRDRGGASARACTTTRARPRPARSATRAPRAAGCTSTSREFAVRDRRRPPAGERGELLVTPLGRTGFPVLRYRTGDVVLNTDERCPAGHDDRWLPGGIVGRTDDMVVIRGMNVYPSAIEEAVRIGRPARANSASPSTPRPAASTRSSSRSSSRTARRRAGSRTSMRQQLGLRVRIVPVAPGRAAARARASRAASSTCGSGAGREGSEAPASRDRGRAPAPHPDCRASGRATSSAARRTSPPSSASAGPPCARRSSCSPAAT